ncbi:hypothetical protein Golomagni_03466 [Golovinomyces magnicellulatus]|nr:hypothetical protein Golomagni_03466 [Golovinomyces magnicellulatus]
MFSPRVVPLACGRNALRASRLGISIYATGKGNGIWRSQASLRVQYPSTAYRSIATEKIPHTKKDDFLVKQRRNRPISPHLSAYDVKQTWLGSSAWMRITGLTLSGGFYAFFAAHLLAPAFGAQFGSEQLVVAFASLSPTVQSACKFGLAFPFVFHSLNGIKHLVYDLGVGYSLRVIVYADAVQWALSLLGSGYLAFWF